MPSNILSGFMPAYDPRERENELAQQAEDLAEVLQSYAGQRFMRRLLSNFYLGSTIPADAEYVCMRNFGVELLKDIMTASPNIGMNILASLLNEELSPETDAAPDDNSEDGDDEGDTE